MESLGGMMLTVDSNWRGIRKATTVLIRRARNATR